MFAKFHISHWITALVVLLSTAACEKEPEWRINPADGHYRKVTILYADGNNNLSDDIQVNINELAQATANITDYRKDAVIIYFHSAKHTKYGKYIAPKKPCLLKVRSRNGKPVLDTLKTYPENTVSSSPEVLNKVLTYIRSAMPAEEYNLIFSSHATGYLPEGYYNHSKDIETGFSSQHYLSPPKRHIASGPFPIVERERQEGIPMTKSLGSSYDGNAAHEISMDDFAAALPEDNANGKKAFHSIIFDCCLMGGIEAAYELKDKCNYLLFSPTEILSEGMDYSSIGRNMLKEKADLLSIADDYYKKYNNHKQGGQYRSATISLIDCSALTVLANTCAHLFSKYGKNLDSIDYMDIQRYYTGNYHWFYDFRDIIIASGCNVDELNRTLGALDDCIVYKAATPYFLDISIDRFSGLSMYLPAHKGTYGNAYLNEYYKGLAWNKATGLVK